LSTLTKVLVILLTLFSIFLCGAIVTYVGNVNNYKALYEEQDNFNDTVIAENRSLKQRNNEKSAQMKDLEKKLNERIQQLDDENNRLTVDLRNAERMSLKYQGGMDSLAGVLTSFEQTIGNLEQSLKLTQVQLDKARQEGIKDRKELNEVTASLYEKIVQMAALETDRRRILEQKTTLEDQMNQLIDPASTVGSSGVVTPERGQIKPSAVTPSRFSLNGLITEVGESLVSVSVGSADGVENGTLFHVTRGDEFICDLLITDVDTNKSAGVLELVQAQPKIGDNVSTRL